MNPQMKKGVIGALRALAVFWSVIILTACLISISYMIFTEGPVKDFQVVFLAVAISVLVAAIGWNKGISRK